MAVALKHQPRLAYLMGLRVHLTSRAPFWARRCSSSDALRRCRFNLSLLTGSQSWLAPWSRHSAAVSFFLLAIVPVVSGSVARQILFACRSHRHLRAPLL